MNFYKSTAQGAAPSCLYVMNSNEKIITNEDFEFFRNLIYSRAGINITPNKMDLLRNRLGRRLQALELNSFSEYRNFLKNSDNKEEIINLINCVSTNKTDFFREEKHFEFMTETLKNENFRRDELYIWSCPCSSGEEPYSIAIALNELYGSLNKFDIKILATDISTKMLEKGEHGIYNDETIKNIPGHLLKKYFHQRENGYEIKKEIRRTVYFRYLNLMEQIPFDKKFDFIFCRNVLIYFDNKTQRQILLKIMRHLKDSGYLFTGHSESLNKLDLPLKYIQAAVYKL